MFSMSVKGRQMGTFDWFIGDCLVLARHREIPASLIWSIQWRELARKYLSIENAGYRRGIPNFILRFLLQNYTRSASSTSSLV